MMQTLYRQARLPNIGIHTLFQPEEICIVDEIPWLSGIVLSGCTNSGMGWDVVGYVHLIHVTIDAAFAKAVSHPSHEEKRKEKL